MQLVKEGAPPDAVAAYYTRPNHAVKGRMSMMSMNRASPYRQDYRDRYEALMGSSLRECPAHDYDRGD